MFDLGEEEGQRLPKREAFREAQERRPAPLGLLVLPVCSSFVLTTSLAVKHLAVTWADFNKSETFPSVQRIWKKPRRKPAVLPAGALRGGDGQERGGG